MAGQTRLDDEIAHRQLLEVLLEHFEPDPGLRADRLADLPEPGKVRLEEDLGLDSLARVELVAAIEQHAGGVISEAVIDDIATVGDVAYYLRLFAAEQPVTVDGNLASNPLFSARG